MTNDRRTKAEILAELAKTREELEDLRQRIPAAPAPVPVATALAGCIRALEPLAGKTSRSIYGFDNKPVYPELGSVLKHLIERYGLDLTERVTEPCRLEHVDDLSPEELIRRATRGAF